MGRNGKKAPIIQRVVSLINSINIGDSVDLLTFLDGNKPGRNNETAYLYKMLQLGYLVCANKDVDKFSETATFIIKKHFPEGYNSISMEHELKEIRNAKKV